VTLTTNPAIVLPCGVDEHRMPFGLQVVGRFGGDIELLDIAGALEQAFEGIAGLSRPRPDINALATPRPELKSIVTDPPAIS
jgi:Asp-tRNA(Asn)/Glu-tRNA(Gln) amidotransferase A subunit family amidase